MLLDAFLVRLLPLPVFLRLSGRWAWWLPGGLDRLLPKVRFGHGAIGADATPQPPAASPMAGERSGRSGARK